MLIFNNTSTENIASPGLKISMEDKSHIFNLTWTVNTFEARFGGIKHGCFCSIYVEYCLCILL